jgi:hypothetical protein
MPVAVPPRLASSLRRWLLAELLVELLPAGLKLLFHLRTQMTAQVLSCAISLHSTSYAARCATCAT